MQLLKRLLFLTHKKIPGQLVIQLTDKCNARCPQCGMRSTEKFQRTKLSFDEVKRILDAAAQNGVKAVSFTDGEPFLFFDELCLLMKYAGQLGIEFIRTGTNGFLFRNTKGSNFESKIKTIAEKLAGTPVRNFWISIDSAVPEIHERMRGFPGVISGIEKSLPIFHEFGIYPSANLGINRNMAPNMVGIDSSRFESDTDCFMCDWECFRDPSELFGPILQSVSNPLGLIKKAKNDPQYFRLWWSDIKYYHACDFFSGRYAPDYDKLNRF